jgi:RHS repeat-associated protein
MRGDCLIGLGLAADIGTLVTVTHHAGSWTSGTFYAHHNHRGDIVLTASGTATVSGYDYSAFGSLLGGAGPDLCRFQFSSKERDGSTGFYYGYRFYSPQWQRWTSRDPIMEEGGINLYAFTPNNPGSYADSDGRGIIPIIGGILGEVLCGNRIKNQVWNQYKPGGPNHRPDDQFYREAHCVAHCRIQRECFGGRITSWLGGLGKEIWDELEQWGGVGDGFDWGDMEANRKGRRLGRKCPEKSCEELCKGTR